MINRLLLLTSVSVVFVNVCEAQELAPQQLVVRSNIAPGSNVFTLDQQYSGASSINVFSGADLAYKGNLNSGSIAQMLVSRDGKHIYSASVYMKRIVAGESEMVLQEFDVPTLTTVREIALPKKVAMLLPYRHMLAESSDGKYVFVQNATPATSVTVVDLPAGRVAGEIPTPGCFGVYPARQSTKFSTVCGDGTFASFELNADGSDAIRTASEKVFDVDADPIFLTSERFNEQLIFISYHGNAYFVSDEGSAVKLQERISLTEGIRGQWAPGGFELIGLSQIYHVLFVSMHPVAKDGSHKDPSTEIWAYDLSAKRLLRRSPVSGLRSLTVLDGAVPSIYGLKQKAVIRFTADPSKRFPLKQTHTHLNAGEFNLQVEARP